jgi:hypothetical protein
VTAKSNSCDCCNCPGIGPELRDDIWRRVADTGEDALCGRCMNQRAQQRLGRMLTLADLVPCPFNLFHQPNSWFDVFMARERAEPSNIAEWREADRKLAELKGGIWIPTSILKERSIMGEDKKHARDLVEREARAVGKIPRETFGPANVDTVSFEDLSSWPAGDGDGTLIPSSAHAISSPKMKRARMPQCGARRHGATRERCLTSVCSASASDPREIWEFPEVVRYIRWWTRFAGMDDPATADLFLGRGNLKGLDPDSDEGKWAMAGFGLLAACGVFGDEIARQVLAAQKSTARQ